LQKVWTHFYSEIGVVLVWEDNAKQF
jgi:hypothetical protein